MARVVAVVVDGVHSQEVLGFSLHVQVGSVQVHHGDFVLSVEDEVFVVSSEVHCEEIDEVGSVLLLVGDMYVAIGMSSPFSSIISQFTFSGQSQIIVFCKVHMIQ